MVGVDSGFCFLPKKSSPKRQTLYIWVVGAISPLLLYQVLKNEKYMNTMVKNKNLIIIKQLKEFKRKINYVVVAKANSVCARGKS